MIFYGVNYHAQLQGERITRVHHVLIIRPTFICIVMYMYITINYFHNSNPYSAMLISLHFRPLKVVSRYRDPQLNLKWVKKTHSI